MKLRAEQALKLWHDMSLDQVRDNLPDLSQRQLTILLTIYLEPPPHTVRDLAQKLGVSKPVITRALDSMGKMKLVTRKRDERDKRNVLIHRTLEGATYLDELATSLIKNAEKYIS